MSIATLIALYNSSFPGCFEQMNSVCSSVCVCVCVCVFDNGEKWCR